MKERVAAQYLAEWIGVTFIQSKLPHWWQFLSISSKRRTYVCLCVKVEIYTYVRLFARRPDSAQSLKWHFWMNYFASLSNERRQIKKLQRDARVLGSAPFLPQALSITEMDSLTDWEENLSPETFHRISSTKVGLSEPGRPHYELLIEHSSGLLCDSSRGSTKDEYFIMISSSQQPKIWVASMRNVNRTKPSLIWAKYRGLNRSGM